MDGGRRIGLTIAVVLVLLVAGVLVGIMIFAHVVGRTTSEPPADTRDTGQFQMPPDALEIPSFLRDE
jgi:hypothetical protein